MEKVIQKYLEDMAKKDKALAERYSAKKMPDCIKYITEQARKHLNGKNGAIEDAIVYKWARDFMLGDTAGTVAIAKEEEPCVVTAIAKNDSEDQLTMEF